MPTDTDAIRRLLAEDIARAKLADQDAAAVRDKLNDDHDPERSAWRITELRNHQAHASEARQSFSARTEMLQYIDLGDITADDLIASAVGTPGAAGGVSGDGGTPASGADPDPDATRALRTAPVAAAGPGRAARTIDQDVRNFLDTHHR